MKSPVNGKPHRSRVPTFASTDVQDERAKAKNLDYHPKTLHRWPTKSGVGR